MPSNAAEGTYPNISGKLVATLNGQVYTLLSASDNLEVVEEALFFSKAFGSTSAFAGDNVTLAFTLTNSLSSITITNIAFTDDLSSTLSGLASTSGTLANICGVSSSLSGASELSFTGGSLVGGASCSFSVTLKIPDAALPGRITNFTSQPSGSAGASSVRGNIASAQLEVINTGTLIIDKVTSPLGVTDTFTITLQGGPSALERTLVLTGGTTPVEAEVLVGDGYSAAETGIPAAWALSSATCSNGSPVTNIDIGRQETVTCTFTNTIRPFDLAISKSAVRNSASKLITYTVAAVNNGPTTVTNATIADPVPAGIVAFTGWNCAASGGVTCPNPSGSGAIDETTGSFPSGGRLTYTIRATLAATNTAVTNTASVTTSFGRGLGESKPADNTITHTSRAQIGTLIIDKVTSPLGVTDTFTITLQGGPSALSRTLVMTDGATPVEAEVLVGDGYSAAETGIPAAWALSSATCSNGSPVTNIDIGRQETVTCTFTNTIRPFDLAISKSAVRNSASKLITYTVAAVNNGPTTVTNATIADPVPAGIVAFTGWNCAASGGVTCPNPSGSGAIDETTGSFPSGGRLTYTIRATLAATNTAVTNTASVTTSFGRGLGESKPADNTIINISQLKDIYLPMVFKNAVQLPDLVIEDITTTSSAITVTLRNQGLAATTVSFWVDVYFNPVQPPSLNQPWENIAPAGAVWGVTTIIPAGDALTLTVGDNYYNSTASSSGFPSGAQVYGYVDSINYLTNYGSVLEQNEANNLFGPITGSSGVTTLIQPWRAIPAMGGLPQR